MKLKKTIIPRGFAIYDFKDDYEMECSLQKSSRAFQNCIWLGINRPEIKRLVDGIGWVNVPIPKDASFFSRMHLTQKQVKELLPILEKFVKTGGI